MTDKAKQPDINETSGGVELLDFWAEWCGPCKIMEPVLKELKEELAGQITIREIDVDDEKNSELVQQYEILSVPTYIVLKDGEVVDHFVGVQSKEAITKKLTAALK